MSAESRLQEMLNHIDQAVELWFQLRYETDRTVFTSDELMEHEFPPRFGEYSTAENEMLWLVERHYSARLRSYWAEVSILENQPLLGRRYISPMVRELILERDEWKCLKCGDVTDLEIDHVLPVAKGGSSDLNNLQVLCKACNRAKGANYGDYRKVLF